MRENKDLKKKRVPFPHHIHICKSTNHYSVYPLSLSSFTMEWKTRTISLNFASTHKISIKHKNSNCHSTVLQFYYQVCLFNMKSKNQLKNKELPLWKSNGLCNGKAK